jgi:L-ascorbate metabolism protein UlaG (beta-lactamase superfamily)
MDQKHRLTLPDTGEPSAQGPGSILFIGTATTLIQYGGFTVLTDPNFLHAGEHANLGYGLHSERLTNPALEVEDLPPLDLCLLSHYHGDHWDEVASAKLRKDLPVVTTGHAAKALNDEGFYRTYALDTWETFTARKGNRWLRITSMPGRHGPSVTDLVLPPVMGCLLEWGSWNDAQRFRMYISGDTLVTDDLQEIPQRYPDIHLALLHLGGTKVMGILVTMDAEQGVQIVHMLNPRHILPIHYNDYEGFKSPIEDFLQATREAGFADRVHFLRHGERLSLDSLKRSS